mmetsp:Transcript_17708/g.26521  ORF Transcript_17708/g.26521 Transcript_17708/m.26521 type:complete len:580 (-) Transcript_17708:152-1891(-)
MAAPMGKRRVIAAVASLVGVSALLLVASMTPLPPPMRPLRSSESSEYATFYSDAMPVRRTQQSGNWGGFSPRSWARGWASDGLDIKWPTIPIMWPTLPPSNKGEAFLEIACYSPVLLTMCGLAILGLLIQMATNHAPGGVSFLRLCVHFPPATFKHAELWRLFTHWLLHSDGMHLVFNLLFIFCALDLEGIPYFVYNFAPSTPPLAMGSGYTIWVVLLGSFLSGIGASFFNFSAMIEGLSGIAFALHGAMFGICMNALGSDPRSLYAPFIRGRLYFSWSLLLIDFIRALLASCCKSNTVGFSGHFFGFIGGILAVLLVPPFIYRCNRKAFSFLTPTPSYECVGLAGIPGFESRRIEIPRENIQLFSLAIVLAIIAWGIINAWACHRRSWGFEGGISFGIFCPRGYHTRDAWGYQQLLSGSPDYKFHPRVRALSQSKPPPPVAYPPASDRKPSNRVRSTAVNTHSDHRYHNTKHHSNSQLVPRQLGLDRKESTVGGAKGSKKKRSQGTAKDKKKTKDRQELTPRPQLPRRPSRTSRGLSGAWEPELSTIESVGTHRDSRHGNHHSDAVFLNLVDDPPMSK